jgi:hypothetical protein
MNFIDLVMDNGELVRVEIPDKHFDDVMDDIENTMKRRDWWSSSYDGVKATYLGNILNCVNMGRVVGRM